MERVLEQFLPGVYVILTAQVLLLPERDLCMRKRQNLVYASCRPATKSDGHWTMFDQQSLVGVGCMLQGLYWM